MNYLEAKARHDEAGVQLAFDLVAGAVFLAVVAFLSTGCFPRAVGPDKKVALYDCVDDGVGDVVTRAVKVWPDAAAVVDNGVDVFCVSPERLESPGICGRSPAKRIESCAAWPGTDFPGSRARIYASTKESAKAVVAHELQHLRPSVWALPDACAKHTAPCWSETELATVVGP